MPRSARLIIPKQVYHLTHRGNNKQKLFFNDEDFRKYLYLFEEARFKNGMEVLAYCIMNNHVHYIAVPTEKDSFFHTIKLAHAQYAKYFHLKHGSVGHVWQGRYYSCLLEQQHLYAALRYVERNPSRAGLVEKPWDWVWSSAMKHVLKENGIITTVDFSNYVTVSSWKDFIEEVDNEDDLLEIRKQTMALKAWGTEDFKKSLEVEFKIKLLPSKMGRPARKVVYVPTF